MIPFPAPIQLAPLSLRMTDFARTAEFPPMAMSAFMDALPRAVRTACDQIGLARPSGVYVELDDARKEEFAANETVISAIHPCTPAALDKVQGLSGHHALESSGVAIVATLRRELHRVEDGALRVFWHLRAVRLPPPDEPGQMGLFT